MAAKMSATTIGLYAVVGLLAAYFLLRPRAAYAQPGRAPTLPPGVPQFPALPDPPPGVDSALLPNYHPPYESSGRPTSEFPMYSVARLSTPIPGRDGPIYRLMKVGTVKDRHDFTDPYTWRGFGPNWEPTGTSYADVQTLNRAAAVSEVVDRNGRVLWTQASPESLSFHDQEYVR